MRAVWRKGYARRWLAIGSAAHNVSRGDETFQGGANAACESACVLLSRDREDWLQRQEIKDVEQERSCRVATIGPGPRRPIGASDPNRHRVSSRITESEGIPKTVGSTWLIGYCHADRRTNSVRCWGAA